MGALSDAELLAGFRAGDEFALEALFERYEAPLFQFLIGILKNHHQAEDALQETFIKTLLGSSKVDPAKLRSWLFTVAYHEGMMVKRKQKRRSENGVLSETLVDETRTGEEHVAAQDEHLRIRSMLDQLPAVQRQVIQARIYHGKQYREIAAELGCPLNTALARMHQGLKKLRQLWENENGRV
jgi:RNA polymerase sigma-70 factor (ECF subfamily)